MKNRRENIMKNNRLWVCPNNDLEAKTIIEMLEREREKYFKKNRDFPKEIPKCRIVSYRLCSCKS